jgi:hypothetical protein
VQRQGQAEHWCIYLPRMRSANGNRVWPVSRLPEQNAAGGDMSVQSYFRRQSFRQGIRLAGESRARQHTPNGPDQATGKPGDVECFHFIGVDRVCRSCGKKIDKIVKS